MSIESAITFFFAIFIFGITPGPGVFAILARALTEGAKKCFWLSFGMAISDIVYLILACFGLAAIAENWSSVFLIIRIAGALYLFYLGYKMWTTKMSDMEIPDEAGKKGFASFMQGFLISASNPKVILFYIAFLPTFVDLTMLNGNDIAMVSLITLLGLMLALMFIAFSASSARKYFKSASAMRKLHRTAGSLMIGAGSYLVLRS